MDFHLCQLKLHCRLCGSLLAQERKETVKDQSPRGLLTGAAEHLLKHSILIAIHAMFGGKCGKQNTYSTRSVIKKIHILNENKWHRNVRRGMCV